MILNTPNKEKIINTAPLFVKVINQRHRALKGAAFLLIAYLCMPGWIGRILIPCLTQVAFVYVCRLKPTPRCDFCLPASALEGLFLPEFS